MPVNPEFLKRLERVREAIRECPFTVLVWGPGEKAETPQRRKRLAIRQDLEGVVGPDSVVFSEEDAASPGGLQDSGAFATEYTQARAADAVILIPESPGSLAEAALYVEELRGKAIVFATRRGEHGFAREAYATLKIEDVEPEEWEDCERVRRKAREFVETLRVFKFRKTKQVFEWE
jgi:hypothetical protein